ncbi:MAG: hypothetical protein A3H72_00805 [Candidatus Doudnabacteria bacterium RIFCSPLOWO2_02_FULL_48_8]|uniref:Uncharacterized protein n=1 Tax=Candidatus Doudnabacteria bacterium RIFCSPHIGHO2_01_FULL_46_24 TaxID=1817825 RepID=A0A1F5NV02_9BACT|nr:MAG: hypothetical protein A2720_02540 [Candidatus Doudnabacteria bacterium RIFCSPHIGHO2_01_FULL_46_24]OGE94228.1 MAG: hypothetical protein A3E98_00185 [Candidatus Doudnabacteria bacterium RIFCSPHIGHO2_12_FULL_48_11]OGE95444.1 MAG: hypothetical protein A3H72_00805 [Candidatus Doudnabacteria bacterium RIFCSPLOWO2_02_FULL_48_8]
MKKTIIFISLLAVLTFAYAAQAHMPNASSPRNVMMQQMLGSDSVEVINDFEEQMMGTATHEQMESYMEKLFAGSLSAEDQKQMFELIKSNVGANNMMMRGMMGQMMANFGQGADRGMMRNFGSFGPTGYWITMVLIWVLLALGIAALWKYLFPAQPKT